MRKSMWIIFVCIIVTLIHIVQSDSVSAKTTKSNIESEEKWEWPVEGTLSDHFGTRQGTHFGLDIAAEEGKEIRVVEEGTIVKSYYSDSYGNVVFVKHPSGIETVYAHMSKRFVEKGENVGKGTVLGLIGNTGKSKGNHLHFEVHLNEWNLHKTNAVDPMVFLDERQYVVEASTSKIEDGDKLTITIEKGDTLWGISQKFGVTIENLKEWNKLSSDVILAGQTFVILKQGT